MFAYEKPRKQETNNAKLHPNNVMTTSDTTSRTCEDRIYADD